MPQVYRDQRNGQRQFMTAEIRVVWLITQGSRFKSFSATKARSPFSNTGRAITMWASQSSTLGQSPQMSSRRVSVPVACSPPDPWQLVPPIRCRS